VVEAAPASGGGSGFTTVLFLLLLFGVVYFMMIRPQQKRRREAMEMQSSIAEGDEIVTIGGLHGTVVALEDEVTTLEVAPGVQVRFAKQAIARVVQKADAPAEMDEPATEEETAVDEPVTDVADDTVADTRKKD
jgi:preprotein translocase subunit YajC